MTLYSIHFARQAHALPLTIISQAYNPPRGAYSTFPLCQYCYGTQFRAIGYVHAVQPYLVQRPAKCPLLQSTVVFQYLVMTSAERQTLGGPRTRGTDLWLNDNVTLTKILVPTCRYCLNCTKFGQLILRKIIKIVATRCPILRLKCTKFDFGWGSLQRSPRPPSWI